MDNKEAVKILNQSSESMFDSSISVLFRLHNQNQIIIDFSISRSLRNGSRILKKTKSKQTLDLVKIAQNPTKCSEIILNLVKDISLRDMTYRDINWDEYLVSAIDIDKKIIDKATEVLKGHIESVEEIYLDSITEKIDSLDALSILDLNRIWRKQIVPKYNVIEDLYSFESYLEIKKLIKYPHLVLACKTGKILLTEDTTGHYLKVENNEEELTKIKETERVLDKCIDNINPFLIIEAYIDDNKNKYVSKAKDSNELKNYSLNFDYEDFYSKRITSKIKMSLLEGTLSLKNNQYYFKDIKDNMNIIRDEIDKIFELISDELVKTLEDAFKRIKEKYNKPYVLDILNLINDFPKKGITTYISILSGEVSYKMSSYNYDKSTSYGKMSGCKKSFIEDKIRECIDIGIIEDDYYKASFGHYIGLTLSEEARDYLDNYNMEGAINEFKDGKEIKSFEDLIVELRDVVTASRAKALLVSLSNKELPFKKEDLNSLLKFIEVDRSIYRDYEDLFVKSISKIIPVQYKPIFLLNANMTSGVTKKTLKSIYDYMDVV